MANDEQSMVGSRRFVHNPHGVERGLAGGDHIWSHARDFGADGRAEMRSWVISSSMSAACRLTLRGSALSGDNSIISSMVERSDSFGSEDSMASIPKCGGNQRGQDSAEALQTSRAGCAGNTGTGYGPPQSELSDAHTRTRCIRTSGTDALRLLSCLRPLFKV